MNCSYFQSIEKVMNTSDAFLPASSLKVLRLFLPIYILFIIWASLRTPTGSVSIAHFDKIIHLGVYGLLAMVASLGWPQISKLKIWVSALIFGGLMEVAQGTLSATRTPSFGDFAANGIGALAALILVYFLNQFFTR